MLVICNLFLREKSMSPTNEEFSAFYKQYEEACRNRDSAFLKNLLPSDIPDDEFAFVLDMSQQSTLAVDASGVEPRIEQNENQFNMVYEGDLGDGMTELTVDFYFADGKWLKYNPEE